MRLLADKTNVLANKASDSFAPTLNKTLPTSPYGSAWDLLWVGACANPPGPPDAEFFPGEEEEAPAHWVYYAHGGLCCTWGYAVTRESAKSLLAWLQDLNEPIDYAMSRWCGVHNCIVVSPELIGSYNSPGGKRKGSDNDPDRAVEVEELEKGWTRNIAHSATVDVLEKLGHKGPWSGP